MFDTESISTSSVASSCSFSVSLGVRTLSLSKIVLEDFGSGVLVWAFRNGTQSVLDSSHTHSFVIPYLHYRKPLKNFIKDKETLVCCRLLKIDKTGH